MKNKIILISIFLIAGLVFSACSRPNDSTSSSEKGVTKAEQKPSHKDEYGCVFADEYEWCKATEKCVKKAEPCKEISGAQKPERSYNLIEKALLKRSELIPGEFRIGIQKLTLSHLRGIIRWADGRLDTQLMASKENNDWVIVYEGEMGQYTCESVEPFSFPSEMIADCQP